MKTLLTLIASLVITAALGQDVKVSSGKVTRYRNFPSEYVQPRNVDVWVPDGYTRDKRYAVVYMHDGQMLFDSTTTWNKQEWKVDEAAGELMKNRQVKDFIVVGIWNNSEYRHPEYFPQKALEYVPKDYRDRLVSVAMKGEPLADRYLKFIVKEVKPFIDSTYSTYRLPQNTFVAGSSMGGLISMYAMCEYPNVFGAAGCISTHWPGYAPDSTDYLPKAIIQYMDKNLPNPKNHRFWFDFGTATLDQYYEPWQNLVDQTMKDHSYGPGQWTTRKYPGEDHSERSWSRRIGEVFKFLAGAPGT